MAASRAITKMKVLVGNFCPQTYLAQSISEITRAIVFLPNDCLHMEYLPFLSFFLFERKLILEKALLCELKYTFQSCLEAFAS